MIANKDGLLLVVIPRPTPECAVEGPVVVIEVVESCGSASV
jgi:hypothetical protein